MNWAPCSGLQIGLWVPGMCPLDPGVMAQRNGQLVPGGSWRWGSGRVLCGSSEEFAPAAGLAGPETGTRSS